MKGLLVKDFRLLRQRTRFVVLLLVAALCLGMTRQDSTLVISYLTLVMALFSASSISYDEYDNCYCFLLTLPIDRRTYAREKYLFGMILGISAWLVGSLIHCMAVVSQGQPAHLYEDFMEALMYIPVFVAVLSLILPVQLKYGAERGRMALVVIMGILAVVIMAMNQIVKTTGLPVGRLLSLLTGMGDRAFLLLCFAIAAAAAGISCRISVRIMEKKEL